jgi:hypothetical protein
MYWISDFLERFFEKTSVTPSLHNQVYQERWRDLIQNTCIGLASTRVGTEGSEHSAFLVQILWKTIFTKTSRPARSDRTYLPRTLEGSHTNILNVLDIRLLGRDFLGKNIFTKTSRPARYARTYLPRTLEGSHTNIVGILFLYQTSWKDSLRKQV